MNQYSQLGGIFMAAWLGWVARERRMRTRGRRQLEHCPLLPTCCRCVSGIAHCPIKVPPAHTLTVKCTQRATSLTHTDSCKCEAMFLVQEALALPPMPLIFLSSPSVFPSPSVFFKPGPRPPAGLCSER